MLLEAKEGTSECVEPSAETSPFGASNTFRCLAATGEPVAWPSQPAEPPQLRIEAAYQVEEEEDSGTSGAHARTLLSLTHYTHSLALSFFFSPLLLLLDRRVHHRRVDGFLRAASPLPSFIPLRSLSVCSIRVLVGGGGLLGAEYDEPAAEAPFLVVTLPLSGL